MALANGFGAAAASAPAPSISMAWRRFISGTVAM
jgi:hypothetical protein